MKKRALFRASALLSLVLLALSGCGKAGGGLFGRSSSPDKLSTANLEEAQQAAQKTQIGCFEDRDCNAGVAFLSAAWPDGVTMCTSFLIASDVLATNSHC